MSSTQNQQNTQVQQASQQVAIKIEATNEAQLQNQQEKVKAQNSDQQSVSIKNLQQPRSAKKRKKSQIDQFSQLLDTKGEVFKDVTQKQIKVESVFAPFFRSKKELLGNFQKIMKNNRQWAAKMIQQDSTYFSKLVNIQTPQYLWIGCADSRVPANEIIGLQPGEVFVHRNIANQAPPSDINCLSIIQYAVQVLKVKDIIVSGHYGCGGIKASFKKHDHGPLQCWLSHIRQVRAIYRNQLIYNEQQNWDKLAQLNVKHQVYNIARVPCVQQAWKDGAQLRIHGLIYRLEDGILKDLGLTLSKIEHVPQEYHIIA